MFSPPIKVTAMPPKPHIIIRPHITEGRYWHGYQIDMTLGKLTVQTFSSLFDRYHHIMPYEAAKKAEPLFWRHLGAM